MLGCSDWRCWTINDVKAERPDIAMSPVYNERLRPEIGTVGPNVRHCTAKPRG